MSPARTRSDATSASAWASASRICCRPWLAAGVAVAGSFAAAWRRTSRSRRRSSSRLAIRRLAAMTSGCCSV
jgi:hypothetical protein